MIESTSTLPKALSFKEAVRLFKEWGFQVEPGPRPEEVTLILDAPDHRTYCVHPASLLPQMAAVALHARFLNGAMYEASSPLRQARQERLGSKMTPLPAGNTAPALS